MHQKELSAGTDTVAEFADKLIRVKRPPLFKQYQGHWSAESSTLQVEAPGEWPDGPNIEVRVHRAGAGPNALVVHGWHGGRSDLDRLCHELVESGHTVWFPDLPGHGDSAGERLSIPLGAAVLQSVERLAGSFTVALGHSFGGACLVHSLDHGLSAERIVLLATPTHYGHFVRLMARKAGLGKDEDAILRRLEGVIGLHPDRIDMARQAARLSQPALFIHSADDTIVSYRGAERVASIWPGAQLRLVDGLGHSSAFLKANVVLDQISAFVSTW